VTTPYRDPELKCPACRATLRAFHDRLCCDECNGIMISVAELAQAIADMTGIGPELNFAGTKVGERICPHCTTAMTKCRLEAKLNERKRLTRMDLDRCDKHGVWFDNDELAEVLAAMHRVVSPQLSPPNPLKHD
jgi:Zn-finger nucleic acid-binding protein